MTSEETAFSKMNPTATDRMEGRVWRPGVFPELLQESRSEVFTNENTRGTEADTTGESSGTLTRTPRHRKTCFITPRA